MIDLKKITSRRGQNATSLLGLSLDGSRLEGVWLKRTNGALQVAGSFAATLTLDPLTAAAELVGREIRNHLDAAEIRERRCIVAHGHEELHRLGLAFRERGPPGARPVGDVADLDRPFETRCIVGAEEQHLDLGRHARQVDREPQRSRLG